MCILYILCTYVYWQIFARNSGRAGHKIISTERPEDNGTLTRQPACRVAIKVYRDQNNGHLADGSHTTVRT